MSSILKRDQKALEPERYCAIALTHLYEPDPLAAWSKVKYKADHYIMSCVTDPLPKAPTVLQQELLKLCPSASTLNLYIPTHTSDQPNIALSLKREARGFRLTNDKIREIDAPTRDGVLLYWHTLTPPPDMAAGLPVHLCRIFRGGLSLARLLRELETSTEMQRQLCLCTSLATMLTAIHKQEVTVWHSGGGKAAFYFDHNDTDDPTLPYRFSGARMRSSRRSGNKLRAKIYGDVPADQLEDHRGPQPRYFGVQIKNATEHDFDEGTRTRVLIWDILRYGFCPMVGLFDGTTTQVFALNFDPTEKITWPTLITTARVGQDRMPAIKQESATIYTPNRALMQILKNWWLLPQCRENFCQPQRVEYLLKLFSSFISPPCKIDDVAAFYAQAGMPFKEQEIQQMKAWKI